MSEHDAVGGLRALFERGNSTSVLVAARNGESTNLQRLLLHEEVADAFRGIAKAAIPVSDDVDAGEVLRKYDPGYTPDGHEVCFLRVTDAPEVLKTVEEAAKVESAALFEEAEDFIGHLRFYAIVVRDSEGKGAVFLRAFGSRLELARRGLLTVTRKKGTYNRFDEKVFGFDRKVDCLFYDGYLFIRNITGFHRLFRELEALREDAEQTVDDLGKRIPIANLEDFKKNCVGQLQMMAKLARIAHRPYLAKVTVRDLKRTIKAFKLEVEFRKGDDGRERLVFDPSPSKRWLILKLLDDDYLGSIMTKEKYEVNSKARLAGGGR